MSDDPPLDTAIAMVYDTVLDPSAWNPALAALAEAFGASMATRFRFDYAVTRASEFYTHGVDASVTQRYVSHFHAIDPAASVALRSATGRWHGGTLLLDCKARNQQEFVVDFALPSGMGYNAGAKIETTSPLAALWFSVQRPPDAVPFGAPAERTFARLLPHLQRVARMERQMATLARGQALARASLDAFGAAVFVVDTARQLQLHNRAGERLLAGDGPLRSRHGRLACAHARTDERLAKAVSTACGRAPAGAALQVNSGPSQPNAAQSSADAATPQSLHLMVVPLPPQHSLAAVASEPLALVIAADPQSLHLERAAYQSLLGLSDAESALLHAMVHGRTVEAWANERGTSRNTVRTQLYSIFAKTGVDSQARLIGLAKTLPAVTGPNAVPSPLQGHQRDA